ncbi:MAG: prolyl oligopeptidase family serine peptidase [Acidobacteriota bacterium]
MQIRTLSTLFALAAGLQAASSDEALDYPQSRRVDHVDVYHGAEVADPYRWLEDLDSAETRDWIEAQNKVTFSYLESIPVRDEIRSRMTELWDYEKFGVPEKQAGRYFFSKNDGLQNQSVIYTMKNLADQPEVLLDPNLLSEDGTVALTDYQVSEDGRLFAYGIASAGSDWQEWKVRNVETGQDLSDHLKWVKFSTVSWTHDNKGFYYSRYDAPTDGEQLEEANYFQKVYYHRIGAPQSEDQLVYHRPDQKKWGFDASVTDDGNYLVIHVWEGTDERNRLFYQDLRRPEPEVVELLTDFDAGYYFIGNTGPVFWFLTDLDAPRRRVIAIDSNNPGRDHWKELIPQAEETLVSVDLLSRKFVASYLKDAHSQVKVFDLNGQMLRALDLPGLGTASGFSGDPHDSEAFYSFTSFITPPAVYRYDVETGRSELFRRPQVDFNPADYETRQIFYESKDGTRVPMFITHKKGLELDGNNPTLLYGYGGFNIAQKPSFSVTNLVWMERGGVFALANIRGGGEYGEEWHQAGMKVNKQNVFDDFIAAGEWLIENQYTSNSKLSIMGRSNGGLLVGACITQRPDLFGAAIVGVGVLDMLRFNEFTIGWAWVSDYGSAQDAEEFKALYAYSPYHNITPGTHYPSTLITTADHDDRVVPAHSYKFAAALQPAQGNDEPILIRIDTRAGHGSGKPTSKQIEEYSDILSFLSHELKD